MLRLERQFGLCGVVLQWYSSYLLDSAFQVMYGSSTSSVVITVCSVLQSSVLAPHLFILYMADLADVAAAHDINIDSYADDTQLYLQCLRQNMMMAIQRLEMCISDVNHWMAMNRLKLNPDKTELLGWFQIWFCFSCWQWTATKARRRDHHSQQSRANTRCHHLVCSE